MGSIVANASARSASPLWKASKARCKISRFYCDIAYASELGQRVAQHLVAQEELAVLAAPGEEDHVVIRVLDHPADVLDDDPGAGSVRDLLDPGDRVRPRQQVDRLREGPVLVQSSAYPVPPVAAWAREREDWDLLKAVVWAHQEWMLRDAWGPLLAGALEMADTLVRPRGLELV